MSNILIQGTSPGLQIQIVTQEPTKLPAAALAAYAQRINSGLAQNPTPNVVITPNNTQD